MSGAEFQRMAHRALEQLGDAAKLCLERDVGAARQPFLQQAVEAWQQMSQMSLRSCWL